MKSYKTIDEYIKNSPKEVQPILQKLRATIKKAAPDAEEKIAYGIPTFFLGKNLVHFGAYKSHIGFYPAPSGITAFKKELSQYESGKGTIKFPLDKPLPFALITKIVRFRVTENTAKYMPKSEFPKISAPANRALANAQIKTLKDLSKWSEKELLALHGIGPSAIPPLKTALKARGLSFKK